MYVTITSTDLEATDLGYLLHKHPDRAQRSSCGRDGARLLPRGDDERCTAALLLEVDPIAPGPAAGRVRAATASALGQYVNDRPYAASRCSRSRSARCSAPRCAARCDARPELAGHRDAAGDPVPALPCRGGAELVRAAVRAAGLAVDGRARPAGPEHPRVGRLPLRRR